MDFIGEIEDYSFDDFTVELDKDLTDIYLT